MHLSFFTRNYDFFFEALTLIDINASIIVGLSIEVSRSYYIAVFILDVNYKTVIIAVVRFFTACKDPAHSGFFVIYGLISHPCDIAVFIFFDKFELRSLGSASTGNRIIITLCLNLLTILRGYRISVFIGSDYIVSI